MLSFLFFKLGQYLILTFLLKCNYLIVIGYTTCKHIFDRKLEKFCESSPDIERWIKSISKEKWSTAYDEEGRRYGHMTTNLSEAVNKILKGARNLPITALVKCTYSRLVEYFVRRGSEARQELMAGHRFSKKLMDAIKKCGEEATSHEVRRYDIQSSRFEVHEPVNPVTQKGGHTWSVNLDRRSCQCGRFQTYKYPCSHVIAACAAVSIDYWQFVDPVYSVQNIVYAYSAEWWPIGNEEMIPPTSGWRLVPDESTLRGKGRPKSTRIRNEMDWRESQPRQKCRRCRSEGHNARQCPRNSQGQSSAAVDDDYDLDLNL